MSASFSSPSTAATRLAPRAVDLEHFVRERQARWSRLESLLNEVDRLPERAVGAQRLLELVRLYRQTCADLNEARAYTANPQLLGRLNQLAGRGYRFVYRRSHTRPTWAALRELLAREIPAAFRRERLVVLAAAAAFVVGVAVGAGAVLADPLNAERLIPAEFFTESPHERVERIEQEPERIDSTEEAAAFGTFLFSHNIQVSLLVFSLGALTLVGGIAMLFYNGVILGAVAATYVLDGVPAFFFAWVGPHGALEIPAIIFGGAAGLRLGRALLLPGGLSTATSLRRAFPSVWRMLLGTAIVLVIAGLVEGSFSQFSARIFPYPLKIGVAAVLFVLLLAALFLRRREPEAAP